MNEFQSHQRNTILETAKPMKGAEQPTLLQSFDQNLKKIVLIRSKKIHWLKNFLDKNDHYIHVESLMDDISCVHSNESCAIHSRKKFILFELMIVYDSLSCHNLYSFMHQLFFLDVKF
jgi:hypothetical protein